MTPPGQNYPIHEHGFLFWGLYLGAIVTMTVVLLGLFLFMVQRNSQATRAAEAEPTPAEPTALAQDEAPQLVPAPAPAQSPTAGPVAGGPHAA